MARRDLPGTDIDTLSAENEGRMGTDQYSGQIRTLLLYRMWMLSRKGGTVTVE
jgi:hypothetical protein